MCRQQAKGRGHGRHDDQPEHVVAHRLPELGLAEHLRVVVEADEFGTPAGYPLGYRQTQRFKNRIGQIQAEQRQGREKEQPWAYHVRAVDVATGMRTPRRKQHLVEQHVGKVEITDAAADTDNNCNESLKSRIHRSPFRIIHLSAQAIRVVWIA